jgi:hypothetical protein
MLRAKLVKVLSCTWCCARSHWKLCHISLHRLAAFESPESGRFDSTGQQNYGSSLVYGKPTADSIEPSRLINNSCIAYSHHIGVSRNSTTVVYANLRPSFLFSRFSGNCNVQGEINVHFRNQHSELY